MKKIIIIILGLILFGCDVSNTNNKQYICKSDGNLKENKVAFIHLWNNDIELMNNQVKNECLEPFQINKKQIERVLEITDGTYVSTDDVNIIDESLHTNMQAFASPEFYDQLDDPIINLIKEKRVAQKIEIKKNSIFLNEEELKNIRVYTAIQNEQGVPRYNFGIYGMNKDNREIRILFASDNENILTIIEEYDLQNEGYSIYKVYQHFKNKSHK